MNFTLQYQPFLGPAQGITTTSFAEQWIIHNLEINDAAVTKLSGNHGIYSLYEAECAQANRLPLSRIAFSKKIEQFVRTRNCAFLKTRTRDGVVFEGVGFTPEASLKEKARVYNKARLEEEARPHEIKERAGLKEEGSQKEASQEEKTMFPVKEVQHA
ncbi:hypothetical protein COCOBI_pt-0570 (chloroplast) [Coccomyxa sp. Obi]|nr:hypothetical protein COCOBI_pt-0570 [Coccomyxa sp. Obi]